ncbi:MAG: hypothetical protein V3W18_06780 [candidate division Zixibacteria bacterium]
MKSRILIIINVLLIIANLILLNSFSLLVFDLSPARYLKSLTHDRTILLGKNEISLPSGYYLEGTELLDGGSEMITVGNRGTSALKIDHLPSTENCAEIITYENLRKTFLRIGDESYYSHGINQHYILDNSDVYISIRVKPIRLRGFYDIYSVHIPDKCLKIYLVGFDIQENELFEQIKYVAFHNTQGDFLFINEE